MQENSILVVAIRPFALLNPIDNASVEGEEEMHRGRWIVSALILLIVAGSWIYRIAHADGDVTAAFHNSYGMSVGDCLKDPQDLTVVNCSDPAAVVTVLQKASDSKGDNCPTTTNAIITEQGKYGDTYWCVLDKRNSGTNSNT